MRQTQPDEAILYARAVNEVSAVGDLLAKTLALNPLGVLILLDLDGFGRVNERFGVRLGDRLLHRIASSLERAVGDDGTTRSFGGDQFIAVLPGQQHPDRRTGELLAAVRRTTVRTSYGRPVRVTASAGIALWPEGGQTGGDLVATADRALTFDRAVVRLGPRQSGE